MDKENFFKLFQESLEIESSDINLQTVITDLDEWDSVAALMLISMVSNEFDKLLEVEDVLKLTTVESLIEIIGREKFSF